MKSFAVLVLLILQAGCGKAVAVGPVQLDEGQAIIELDGEMREGWATYRIAHTELPIRQVMLYVPGFCQMIVRNAPLEVGTIHFPYRKVDFLSFNVTLKEGSGYQDFLPDSGEFVIESMTEAAVMGRFDLHLHHAREDSEREVQITGLFHATLTP